MKNRLNETNAEILENMLDLLNSPEKWCHGAEARNADGVPVVSTFPEAASWCLMGALWKTEELLEQYDHRVFDLLIDVIDDYTGIINTIVSFNDSSNTTYEDMRLVLKKALEKCQERN